MKNNDYLSLLISVVLTACFFPLITRHTVLEFYLNVI